MEISIVNKTKKEMFLGLEPEGDAIPLAPGQILVIKANGARSDLVEVDIEEEVLSICVMCEKEVWCEDVRLK
jgi:hypothetical protein